MTHPTIPRWQRALVIAASLLLSTGVAASAAATSSPPPAEEVPATAPAGEQAPTTEISPEAPAVVEPTIAAPTTVETSVVDPAPVDTTASASTSIDPPVVDPTTAPPAPEAPAAPPAVPVAENAAGEGSEGPTITVNGQPFKGQSDPKLEGCSIILSVTGLSDGSHTIFGAISSGEEGAVTLVSIDAAFDGTSWTDSWALDDLVGDLEQKPNGYQVRISLTIDDGASIESRPFWLACGAEQDGNPFVVVLDKQWQAADGTVLDGPPANLPDDWAMNASSKLGNATCTYPEGSDELVCEYDNKGSHEGATEGLYVPGGKKHTYTVAESAPPEGWSLVSGTGTFSPREVCPGGGEEGHEAAAEEPGGRPPCPHLVINRQDPIPTTTTAPTTSTTTATTSTVPLTTSTAPGTDVEGTGTGSTQPADTTLARTGADSAELALAALVLLASGFVLLEGRRRALRRHS